MGAQISQVQPSQGNQPVNPRPTSANYSPVQQQYGGGKGGVMPMQANPTGQTPLMAPKPIMSVPFDPYSTTTEQDMMGRGGTGASFGQIMSQMGMGGGMGFPSINGQVNAPTPEIQQPIPQPQGKGGRKVMYSPTSNQPSMGQPNPYPNTVGQWDNASIQPQPRQSGKGKGI